MLKVKIVPNDIKLVAKVILINEDKKVLFLKRSNYVEKYAGELDLPGGHLKEGEENNMISGLKREVKEETGLSIKKPEKLCVLDNLHFFYCQITTPKKIKLSSEHTSFSFLSKSELDENEKFQKKALDALEKIND